MQITNCEFRFKAQAKAVRSALHLACLCAVSNVDREMRSTSTILVGKLSVKNCLGNLVVAGWLPDLAEVIP